jgi:hypothetical protein
VTKEYKRKTTTSQRVGRWGLSSLKAFLLSGSKKNLIKELGRGILLAWMNRCGVRVVINF